MAKGYIYKYTFPDGKVYIGQTRRPPEERHREHFDEKIGKLNTKFWEAYETIGMPDFEIIDAIESKRVQDLVPMLNEAETKYIQQYKAANPEYGYNVRERAYVVIPRDKVLEAEFERKWNEIAGWWYPIYESVTEKCLTTFEPLDEEELEFCYGLLLEDNLFADGLKECGFNPHNLRDNTGEKMVFYLDEALNFAEIYFKDLMYDYIHGYIEENKERILAENLPETTIVKIDKNGRVVKEYVSLSEIREEMGLSRLDNIYNVLVGKQRTAYGYIWRYKKDLRKQSTIDENGQMSLEF